MVRYAAVLACLVALAACSDDGSTAVSPAPTPTEALWNPCDGLETSSVSATFDATMAKQEGTPVRPVCTFTPLTEGDPVLDANYMLFPEGLDAAWATLGDAGEDTTVTEPQVLGADAARLVVDIEAGTLLVSGFVQNGDLIQTVDVVDPRPYDQDGVVRGVRTVMAELSEHAGESGLN